MPDFLGKCVFNKTSVEMRLQSSDEFTETAANVYVQAGHEPWEGSQIRKHVDMAAASPL